MSVILPADLLRHIERNFAKADRAAAVTLLLCERSHKGVAGPRLQRCALVASNGSLERLMHVITRRKLAAIRSMPALSFRDDAVRPFHERDKDRWIAEFCAPLGEIGVSHSTGAGARTTRKYLNLLRHNFLQRFLERGPADRDHGLGQ
jgi:hypothetical protein